nr:hypothetical protein [Actinocrispum wychmicini]
MCQLIRVGVLPVAKRRSRMVVPAHALAHLAVADNGTPDPLTGGRP